MITTKTINSNPPFFYFKVYFFISETAKFENVRRERQNIYKIKMCENGILQLGRKARNSSFFFLVKDIF